MDSPTNLRQRFLLAVQEAYRRYLEHGPRSNKKLKALHGWVIDELISVLGEEYVIQGLSDSNTREVRVQGKYHPKKVDVAISRGDLDLGVVSIKFVMRNYKQNKINYFEQQLGETANLRESDLVFGHIMVRMEPTPYYNDKKEITRLEHMEESDINLYLRLMEDHSSHHVPDVQCVAVFKWNQTADKVIRLCEKSDLPKLSSKTYGHLNNGLSIDRFFTNMGIQIKAKYERRH